MGSKDFALELFTSVKYYILAQQARKEGMKLEGPLWETPLEKRIIVSLLMGKLVEEEPVVEPTKEEIIDFYRSHPMYHGTSFEGAKKRVYQRLKSEKTRQAAIDRLKERFKVKIF